MWMHGTIVSEKPGGLIVEIPTPSKKSGPPVRRSTKRRVISHR